MSPNKVVVVFHEPQAGGAVVSVLRIVPLLEERGWRFAFWVSRPSELYDLLASEGHEVGGAPRYIDHSLRALRVPPGPRRRLASVRPYLRAFRRFLEDQRPALVHANSILTVTEGVAAASRAAVLLHVHEMVPRDLRGRLARWLAASRLDEVVTVSRTCAEAMRSSAIVYEAAPIPEEAVAIATEPRPFTLGTVGVVSRRKGTDLFVDAALRAAARNPELRFEIVGGGIDEREPRWAAEVLARAATGPIEYLARADVDQRLRAWDAFALPSRQDPFPISMLEAMAIGLPVIGSDVDGIAEQITPGCGLLVPGEDAGALGEAMLSLSRAGAEERSRLGAAARARVAENFTLQHQADALHEAYVSALAAHRARGAAT